MFGNMKLDITTSLKAIAFLKDVPAKAMKAAGREASWFCVPAGGTLFLRNEPADMIYFVLSGALGAFRVNPNGQSEFVGHIRPGEPVGEMALFLGGIDLDGDGTPDNAPHTSSVYALRDCEVVGFSREGWRQLVKSEPELLEHMIRIILRRVGREGQRNVSAAPKVFTLVATSPTIDLELRAEALKASVEALGKTAVVVGERMGADKPAAFFDDLEQRHDVVILISTIGDTRWYRLSVRQADRIWVVGRADAKPSNPLMPDDDSPARELKLVDVLLLHPGDNRRACRPVEWLEAAGASRLFHWQGMDGPNCDRLARVMAGVSVGLILSGGGARAYSHIGVVRAMRDRRIPIDFVGGASMGAVIAACVAMGWDDAEIDRRIRKAFVETNPLGDYTLPVVGMVKGVRVNARLKEHFGDAEIGDLVLPFFSTSTSLMTGTQKIHRTGLLREALRATISLPGILPPVVDGNDLLVDGAVLNNFPVDVMRDMHRGFVIGSDVTRQPEGLKIDEFQKPAGFFRWVAQHGFSNPPPIAGVLMRSATIRADTQFGRDMTDVLILPELVETELRDWENYDATVESGYQAALLALDAAGLAKSVRPQDAFLVNV
ncbi:patatin-like phospholipase family protein [uncultured Hyphomonas sp.]|uniref:patatin-like phospholipase family protein n=1 Tax=uncultured Hyphomonas sp. TaxID=225298 RepID=UPI002AAC1846|nr:patatin-like phospholipase family protein [uncultured Hyphomonas sp.]